jgi:hypothetical protein
MATVDRRIRTTLHVALLFVTFMSVIVVAAILAMSLICGTTKTDTTPRIDLWAVGRLSGQNRIFGGFFLNSGNPVGRTAIRIDVDYSYGGN